MNIKIALEDEFLTWGKKIMLEVPKDMEIEQFMRGTLVERAMYMLGLCMKEEFLNKKEN